MEEFIKLIADQFRRGDVSNIKPESRFVEDLGMDSVDTMELCFLIEEHYNIEVTDEELQSIVTVQKAYDFAQEKKTRDA